MTKNSAVIFWLFMADILIMFQVFFEYSLLDLIEGIDNAAG
jgi:hypothetical protein